MSEHENSKAQLLEEISELRAKLASVDRARDERSADLYKSEELFAVAMRSANDGLWDWDLLTDRVYYSPRWKSMLGYEEHELEACLDTWATLVHPDEKTAVLEKVQDYLNGRISAFEVEMRMRHKAGHSVFIRSRAFKVVCPLTQRPTRLIGTHVDISHHKKSEIYDKRHNKILEMIAKGEPATLIYDEIALLYEARHPGLRCSMLELEGNKLMHGGAPSMPKAYCEAVHGLEYGPEVGSCGSSTYIGKRVVVENIETDPKWADIKHYALPHGMRCCWSEPIKNSDGKVLGAFGMYYNHPARPNEEESEDLTRAARLAGIIMEREHNQKQIRALAYTDELTGLSSRAHFYLRLEELIKVSKRNGNQFSLLYIDLDDFKHVNDSLGHDVGDLLLQEIARRLQKARRDIDFIARLSGDEFCILVRDITDEQCAIRVAKRCLKLISETVEFEGRRMIPSCSIGLANYPEDGTSLQALLKAADTALYEAKDLGRNRYAFYNLELTYKAEYRFKVEQFLRDAIEQEHLYLVYQPQVDIASGDIIGVEALSRWYHPQLGQVEPTEFIATVERIGLIKPLTEWVLRSACQQAAKWQKAGYPPLRVAVNISPSHFLDKDLVPLIHKVLDESGLDACCLELEVTEGVVQTNPQNLLVFSRLKELGVTLAIDDFGTGYSSFASLKHLNVDFLKIDKYFIDDLLSDSKSRLLVESMVEMGHNLGYRIIAEGIESADQLSVLGEIGCDTAQGFLTGKPLSATEITTMLNPAALV